MTETWTIDKASLQGLFAKLVSAGYRVVAPVRTRDQLALEEVASSYVPVEEHMPTALSAKSITFPPHEALIRYGLDDGKAQLDDAVPNPPPTVLFGIHPCDAAAFDVLSAVFLGGDPDAHFRVKRECLTLISLSCTESDEYCFCTSVGLGPGDARGSDILMTPVERHRYLVEAFTDKGRAVISAAPGLFAETDGAGKAKEAVLARVPVRFSADRLADRLPSLFAREELWADQSLRCLGCGVCAYVCPACSCFDIQDECGRQGGARLRCWDSCGFSVFTLHASGHNPRLKQSHRWRQRVMHKFCYQPQQVDRIGCVGCGRCSRACPVDMSLADQLATLAETQP
jgi:formate hydrogenlyase subunit 6/NADH:ubiquinone oxidoreductase subunit I